MYATKVLNKSLKDKSARSKFLFYCCLIAIPVLQFLIFYVYINFNSILMAFRKYDIVGGSLVYSYSVDNFKNFSTGWNLLFSDTTYIRNSSIFFFFNICVNIPLALFSSYYLFKKKHASGFYKVMLFMPQVLSSVVLALIYKYLLENAYPAISGREGLFTNPSTRLGFTLLFSLVMSFGVNVLIYTSAMGGINDSLIESAQLDGCNSIQEFIHIVLPLIYPTISTLLIVSLSYFFMDQYHVYTLFEVGGGNVSNVGYYLYMKNLNSTLRGSTDPNDISFPVLSAIGLMLTAIILPITLIARKLLNKLGPSAE